MAFPRWSFKFFNFRNNYFNLTIIKKENQEPGWPSKHKNCENKRGGKKSRLRLVSGRIYITFPVARHSGISGRKIGSKFFPSNIFKSNGLKGDIMTIIKPKLQNFGFMAAFGTSSRLIALQNVTWVMTFLFQCENTYFFTTISTIVLHCSQQMVASLVIASAVYRIKSVLFSPGLSIVCSTLF